MPVTYRDLAAALDGKISRIIAHNTTAHQRDGFIRVSLHGTGIADVYEDGTVWITDGGYVTTTTYDRLKRLVAPLGATVFRRSGTGYVRFLDGTSKPIGWEGVQV
jgi:hypothetical protein